MKRIKALICVAAIAAIGTACANDSIETESEILPTTFFDDEASWLTSGVSEKRSALSVLRERFRALVGEMSADEEKAFDAKWDAAIEYPSVEVMDWAKAAAPKIAELLRLKGVMDSLWQSYYDCMAEAHEATECEDVEASDLQVRQAGRIAEEMRKVEERMNKLSAELAALGDLPDAEELRNSHKKAWRDAKDTVKPLIGGGEVDGEIQELDGEYDSEERWLSYFPVFNGVSDTLHLALHPSSRAAKAWDHERLYIKTISQFEDGLVACYICGEYTKSNGEKKTYGIHTFAESDGNGGISYYEMDSKSSEVARVTLRPETDRDGKSVLVVRVHEIKMENGQPRRHIFDSRFMRRTSDPHFTDEPPIADYGRIEGTWGKTQEEKTQNAASRHEKDAPKFAAAKETFERLAKTIDISDAPRADEVYYTLENIEEGGKGPIASKPKKGISIHTCKGTDDLYLNLARDPAKPRETPSVRIDCEPYSVMRDINGISLDLVFGIYKIAKAKGKEEIESTLDTATIKYAVPFPKPPEIFRAIDVADFECEPSIATVGSRHDPAIPGTNITAQAKWKAMHCGSTNETITAANCTKRTFRSSFFPEGQVPKGYGVTFQTNATCKITYSFACAIPCHSNDKSGFRQSIGDYSQTYHYVRKIMTLEAAEAFGDAARKESDAARANAIASTQLRDEAQLKADRITFHNENIKFIEGTIARLKGEIANERDEARRRSLEFSLVCEQSNLTHERDLLRAEETGKFTRTRTAFDDMCRAQVIADGMMQEARRERMERAKKHALYFASKLPAEERETTERLIANTASKAEAWEKTALLLGEKHHGYLEHEQAMAQDKAYAEAEATRRLTTLRDGCGLVLTIASGGVGAGASAAQAALAAAKAAKIVVAYEAAKGYMEGGVGGAAKNVALYYSSVADIANSAYEGYKEGGFGGALESGGFTALVRLGIPYVAKRFKGGQNPSGVVKSSHGDDVAAYREAQAEARKMIAEFSVAKRKFNNLNLSKISDAELKAVQKELAIATAKINSSPVAKGYLKYGKYKSIAKGYVEELDKVHAAVQKNFHANMKARGFNEQQLKQIRNKSSAGTVGMDADWGLVETPGMKITCNGKPVSKHQWNVAAQEAWNEAYRKVTGEDALKAWENITSSAHSEVYRNLDILKVSKDSEAIGKLLDKIPLDEAHQIADLTRFKANEMTGSKMFPRLVGLRESCRGTSKDLVTKFLPAIDSRLKPLEAEAKALGKKFPANKAAELERLTNAKDRFSRLNDAFDKIGKGQVPPEKWDDMVNTVTGGKGIDSTLNDLADFFTGLALH